MSGFANQLSILPSTPQDSIVRVLRRGALTLGLYFDQTHSWVLCTAIVYAVSHITEPCGSASAPNFLDPRIGVGSSGGCARHGDPILRLGVLEGNIDFLVGFDILEFLGVRVGEEEEVGAGAFG